VSVYVEFIATGRFQNRRLILLQTHVHRLRAAKLFESRKIPEVWKVAALLRFDGVDAAIAIGQEDAGAIVLIGESQAGPLLIQARECLDELVFGKPKELRHSSDFSFREAHLPGPAAARSAAVAFEENRHCPEYRHSVSKCPTGLFIRDSLRRISD
jgi:hypothetical protein